MCLNAAKGRLYKKWAPCRTSKSSIIHVRCFRKLALIKYVLERAIKRKRLQVSLTSHASWDDNHIKVRIYNFIHPSSPTLKLFCELRVMKLYILTLGVGMTSNPWNVHLHNERVANIYFSKSSNHGLWRSFNFHAMLTFFFDKSLLWRTTQDSPSQTRRLWTYEKYKLS